MIFKTYYWQKSKLLYYYHYRFRKNKNWLKEKLVSENNLFYKEEYRKNQDYELFVRAIDITEYANLPDRLIKYRQTEDNVKREVHNQKENVLRLQKMLFHKIGIEITDHKLQLYKLINKQEYHQSREFLIES